MTELSPDQIDELFAPARAATTYSVEIDGEAVLLDEQENRLHLLNHSAALLWACFDGHAAVGELATELSEELRVPYDIVLADTLAIVRHLGDEGLLEGVRRSDAGAGAGERTA